MKEPLPETKQARRPSWTLQSAQAVTDATEVEACDDDAAASCNGQAHSADEAASTTAVRFPLSLLPSDLLPLVFSHLIGGELLRVSQV